MKALHKPNLFCWSLFNEERNLDFHSVFWMSSQGNVVIDPLELSPHDFAHIESLGGVQEVVITNSDHQRTALTLAKATQARVWGPASEPELLDALGAQPVADGEEPIHGLKALELHGSKTPGELALIIENHTLLVGDLVRGHRAGRLNLLPDAKLLDKPQALASLERLAQLQGIEAVLVGDGWPVFHGGHHALHALLIELEGP